MDKLRGEAEKERLSQQRQREVLKKLQQKEVRRARRERACLFPAFLRRLRKGGRVGIYLKQSSNTTVVVVPLLLVLFVAASANHSVTLLLPFRLIRSTCPRFEEEARTIQGWLTPSSLKERPRNARRRRLISCGRR